MVRIRRRRLRRAAAARRADFSPRRRDFSPGAVSIGPKTSSHIRRLAEFPQKKHNLVQAILAVDDLHVTAKEHVLEFFREDVEELLRREEIPFVRDLKLSGRSGLDHKFDIMLPGDKRHPERVLKAINTLRRDTAMTYAFSVDDVRNVRGRDALGAFAVVNDTQHEPAPEHLDALRNYGIVPILWSERDRVRDLIAA